MSDQKERALIHLNVPRETKARWVHASRAGGLRLTDWITGIVEAEMRRSDTRTEIEKETEHEARAK